MSRRLVCVAGWVVLVVSVAVLAGCGGGGGQNTGGIRVPANRVFYPGPPDIPRYQFLCSFSDVASWSTTDKSSFSDFVVGSGRKEAPKTRLDNPYGIAVSDGKLYVCDLATYCCHVVDFIHNTHTILGDGKNLVRPMSISIGPDGRRYVCDVARRQIAVFDAQDHFLQHLGDPKESGPADVAFYGDELFVVDQPGGKIEVWSKTGELKRSISQAGQGPDQFQRPGGIAIDSDGLIYVSDVIGSAVKVFDQSGKLVRQIGGPGDSPGQMARPKGVRIDSTNNLLYVADPHFDTVQVFDLTGQILLFIQAQNEQPEATVSATWLAMDTSCLGYFKKYIADDFQAEYLLFVANEFGKNKISVYAFGKGKPGPAPATQPRRARPTPRPAFPTTRPVRPPG